MVIASQTEEKPRLTSPQFASCLNLAEGHPIFEKLPPERQRQIANLLRLETLHAGDYLLRYGEPGDSLYFLASGEIDILTRDAAGNQFRYETASAGSVIGEVAFADGQTRTADARVIADGYALRLDRTDWDAFSRIAPEAALALLAVIARRMRRTDEQFRTYSVTNYHAALEKARTPAENTLSRLVTVMASIPFLILNGALIILWAIVNQSLGKRAFDVYPYDFLALILGAEAFVVSTLVLRDQRRDSIESRTREEIHDQSTEQIHARLCNVEMLLNQLTRERAAAKPTTPAKLE